MIGIKVEKHLGPHSKTQSKTIGIEVEKHLDPHSANISM